MSETRDLLEMLTAIVGWDPAREQRIEARMRRMEFAEHLYALRREWGVSQAEFAQRLGLSRSRISRIEQNDMDALTLDIIEQIAIQTGLEFHWEVRESSVAAGKVRETNRAMRDA